MQNHLPSPEDFRNAILRNYENLDPLEELIATGFAAFNLVRFSELDLGIKGAFYQYEKQFGLWASMVAKRGIGRKS